MVAVIAGIHKVKARNARAVTALTIAMFFWGTSAVFPRTTALTLRPIHWISRK
jgi:hypothetical protein